ncbi:MAG TPA: DUF3558 family protein [Candidatus Dormibacteraeota bacterium]|nr:DUF3558 family protein [Candidatus Dormibacteraeota bacterium]
MSRTPYSLIAGLAVLLLAGCSSSSSTANTSAPPSAAASPHAASPSAQASALPASIDPCQLVTSSEAASLTGAAYGAGRQEAYSGNGKGCVYGYQTTNVFFVIVAVAPDAASAQANWAQEQAKAGSLLQQGSGQTLGINITFNWSNVSVTGADQAAAGAFSATKAGRTISGSAIYLLKGPVYVGISDLALGAAPGSSAMQAQALTVIGRLP